MIHSQRKKIEKQAFSEAKGRFCVSTSDENNTCYICGKKFPSDKSLYGHMRLHPERGWKGIRPPQIAKNNSNTSESYTKKKEDFSQDEQSNFDPSQLTWSQRMTKKRTPKIAVPAAHSKIVEDSSSADNLMMLACGAIQEGTNENMSKQSGEKLEVEHSFLEPNNVIDKMDSTSEKEQIGDKIEEINNMSYDQAIIQSINRKRKKKSIRALHGMDLIDHYNNNENKSMVRNKFICGTCKKSFLTHQALGGHMTGHKKHKIEDDQHGVTVPLPETNEVRIEKPHQCKLCDKVFPTGQALGGHQRCHRGSLSDDIGSSSATSHKDIKQMDRRQPLNFDLNEPPLVD